MNCHDPAPGAEVHGGSGTGAGELGVALRSKAPAHDPSASWGATFQREALPRLKPVAVRNEEFLRKVFGTDWENAHICTFAGDPNRDGQWRGDKARNATELRATEVEGFNSYFTVSTFRDLRDEERETERAAKEAAEKRDAQRKGRDPETVQVPLARVPVATRRTHLMDKTFVVPIDDVGAGRTAKVPWDRVRLEPTYVLETSPGNCQAVYVLRPPGDDAAKLNYLVGQMIAGGLSAPNPDGGKSRDPGMAGRTRYIRLPVGTNSKEVYRKNGHPKGFSCRLLKWSPEVTYSVEDVAAAYGIDLTEAPAGGVGGSGVGSLGAETYRVPPEQDLWLKILYALGWVQREKIGSDGLSATWDIDCPFIEEHTQRAATGTVYLGDGRFRCEHGCSTEHPHNEDYRMKIREALGEEAFEAMRREVRAREFGPTDGSEPGLKGETEKDPDAVKAGCAGANGWSREEIFARLDDLGDLREIFPRDWEDLVSGWEMFEVLGDVDREEVERLLDERVGGSGVSEFLWSEEEMARQDAARERLREEGASGSGALVSFPKVSLKSGVEFDAGKLASGPIPGPREFVYGASRMRNAATLTFGPGGVSKSQLTLVEGVAMVIDRKLLDEEVWEGGLRVGHVNMDEPQAELHRRVLGILRHYGVSPAEVEGRLYLVGRDTIQCDGGFKLVRAGEGGAAVIDSEGLGFLERLIRNWRLDVLDIDPIANLMAAGENDNNVVHALVERLNALGGRVGCSIHVVHHARKTSPGEAGKGEPDANAARGAGGWVNATRFVRQLTRMPLREGKRLGVPERDRWRHVRVDDAKANYLPPAFARWLRLESVDLMNGSGRRPADQIGVPTVWSVPNSAGLSGGEVVTVLENIRDGFRAAHGTGLYSDAAQSKGPTNVHAMVERVLGTGAAEAKDLVKRMLGEKGSASASGAGNAGAAPFDPPLIERQDVSCGVANKTAKRLVLTPAGEEFIKNALDEGWDEDDGEVYA